MSGFGWKQMTLGEKVLTVIFFVPVFCLGKAISYAAGRSQLKKLRKENWRSESVVDAE